MTTTTKPWIRRRTTHVGIVLLVFLLWSLAARQWTDHGCDAFPQSYGLAVSHLGTPGDNQGCEDGAYTDDYQG